MDAVTLWWSLLTRHALFVDENAPCMLVCWLYRSLVILAQLCIECYLIVDVLQYALHKIKVSACVWHIIHIVGQDPESNRDNVWSLVE